MTKITAATTSIVSAAKAAGFDCEGKTWNDGTEMEVSITSGAKTVGNGMASFSVRMYLSVAGALRASGYGRTADGTDKVFNSLAAAQLWLDAQFDAPAEEAPTTYEPAVAVLRERRDDVRARLADFYTLAEMKQRGWGVAQIELIERQRTALEAEARVLTAAVQVLRATDQTVDQVLAALGQ